MKTLNKSKHIILDRKKLKDTNIDIEDKTIIIGFNEPKFKKSKKDIIEADIDSKLNARFITYFLPAVEIAKNQKNRPRLFIISGLNMALKWNADNEDQKKIMVANNAIKIDFLKTFIEKFFPKEFSLVEFIVSQDILKIPESKFLSLWNLVEKKYPVEIQEIKFQLTKFLYPKKFNTKTYSELNDVQKKKMNEVDSSIAFKYAISHLFAFGDINFEGNYIHSSNGYLSIGGESEEFFNLIRSFAFDLLKDYGELFFDKEITTFDNYKIVLKNKYKVPPPYNGMFNNSNLLEVTYENGKDISFYDTQEKLKDQMEYMYENLVSKKEYENFWNNYKKRYFDLKDRYIEAYDINSEW